MFFLAQGYQEPMWITLTFVVVYFVLYFSYFLPKELKRKKELDLKYCERKGITYDELIRRRNIARARKIPKSTREYVLKRDNYECQKCGTSYDLQIDHIYPFSLGGGNEVSNLQALCRQCNLSKGASI